jgi:hypothetical protein
MQIYLFWSETDSEVFGFTANIEGENLPAGFAPWSKSGQGGALYLGPAEDLTALSVSNSVIRAVQRDGFYLGRSCSSVDVCSPFVSRSVH